MDDISMYIHIPFCKRKCLYCDFPSFAGCENIFEDYVDRLISEVIENSSEYSHHSVKTIFLGGGTPTVLPPKLIGKIFNAVFGKYNIASNAEITVEANPGTVNSYMLKELRAMEVNRISFGLQAWQDSLLKSIGRIHDHKAFVENYEEAREAGFKNISCDLMFSLPGQTVSQWEETLERVTELKPEHISAYSLIIEDGTPFKEMADRGIIKAADESIDREMYYMANEILKSKGYERYEISNFAKNGFESRHNIAYWDTKEYFGFGLGAHGYINGERFHNTYDMEKYIRAKGSRLKLREDTEVLSLEEKMEEFMFMGLRMTKGIDSNEFNKRFKTSLESVYGDVLDYLMDKKLIEKHENMVCLTEKGTDISNFVFEKFILEKN